MDGWCFGLVGAKVGHNHLADTPACPPRTLSFPFKWPVQAGIPTPIIDDFPGLRECQPKKRVCSYFRCS